ncbi:MAG: hypothetical protein U1F76_14200 [Candidatus Competibacteraceae bacterium]
MPEQLLLLERSRQPLSRGRPVTAAQAALLAGHALRVLRRLAPSSQARTTVLSWAEALMADNRLQPCPHLLRRASRYDLEDLQVELDLWRDEHLLILHERLLKNSLHLLGDRRASQASVTDVWAWLDAVPTVPPRLFSFDLCCRLAGLDPETLYAHLLDLARRGRLRRA